MKKMFIGIIGIYQKISRKFLTKKCIYYPTCSEYTKVAIEKYGIIKGSFLAFKRILRCHPLNYGGYDPVK